ncbi:uncharacterized protein LOC110264332 isoform X1 [Arachis ipaensis]|uniref:uncharacterized protein LOC110264332 isoform X1 n=1 Tax=Arachis ipaensis TaxID=130454 RepID=UPI000A2B691B|nr:uncharacterized protein LOC110264332 isoform X1 [Arachis ipaensis]XP_025668316.1 uncharacterized protein LOC112766633 isoform X1 [Arachis hypogaea]QHN93526.1 uncharacterized protein DS421_17g593460 [Arachis hypogaea]
MDLLCSRAELRKKRRTRRGGMSEPRWCFWGLTAAVPIVAGVVTGEPPSRKPPASPLEEGELTRCCHNHHCRMHTEVRKEASSATATVAVAAGLPFIKGIIDAEVVVVLAPKELMSTLLPLVLNPITLILSYVCF